MERERPMVSRPLTSSSRVLSSVASLLGRRVPRAFLKYDSEGRSVSLRSKARKRESLAESMSFVAAIPASLRAISVSVTGRGRCKKFCQGELVAAKPDRSAMNVIPMTPTRSRQASLSDCWVGVVGGFPSIFEPHHQKAKSHAANVVIWKTHARPSRPLFFPVYS